MSEPVKFVVAPEPFFRFLPTGHVEARTRTKVLSVALSAYRVLLEFGEPRTFDEVLGRIGSLTRAELSEVVSELEGRGLLTRVPPESGSPSGAEERDFLSIFRRGTLDDPDVVRHVAEQLAAGRAVVIPDALVEDVAARVHDDLEGRMRWHGCEEFDQLSHFRFRSADLDRYYPPAILELKGLLGSPSAKRFMGRLSGRNCDGALEFSASWYMPGDYTDPHDDNWAHRSIVGIWNFSKDWDPKWGGSLFWAPSGTHVRPSYNCLTLFNVTTASVHQVCAVSPFAERRRLTVNAWWTNETPPPVIASPRADTSRLRAVSPAAYGAGHVSLPAGIVAV